MNHEPKFSDGARKAVISAPPRGRTDCKLSVTGYNESEKYSYAGSQQPSTSCMLLFDEETQTFTLDTADAAFNFNVRSTPNNKSAKALAVGYPQLETTAPDPESSEEDLFDLDQLSEGDPENPYDYRHYLRRQESSSPDPMEELEQLDIGIIASSPVRESRPVKQRNHRRSSTPAREEADADNEGSSDDGGLEIVMDGAAKPRHRFRKNFEIRSDRAPISLRSAASSLSASPAVGAMDSSSEESDEDMENVRLPSPERGRRGREEAIEQHEEEDEEDEEVVVEEEDEADDGGLAAELEREMEREAEAAEIAREMEDDGGVAVESHHLEESSSESEEE